MTGLLPDDFPYFNDPVCFKLEYVNAIAQIP